jgi:hypothetical protein
MRKQQQSNDYKQHRAKEAKRRFISKGSDTFSKNRAKNSMNAARNGGMTS